MDPNRIEEREAWIDRLGRTLEADGRFMAAWLYGSLGRGDADALSDIDLALVVADEYVAALCRREALTAGETIPERLALFSQFGRPAVIHENHNNAVSGGSFSFVLYAVSGWMVDWSLRPRSGTRRPARTRLLFDRVGIPIDAPDESERDSQQAGAAERAAFFLMMATVTAKYIARGDRRFGLEWLGHLAAIVEDLEGIYRVQAPEGEWIHGVSKAELFGALRGLCMRIGRISDVWAAAQVEVEEAIARAESVG